MHVRNLHTTTCNLLVNFTTSTHSVSFKFTSGLQVYSFTIDNIRNGIGNRAISRGHSAHAAVRQLEKKWSVSFALSLQLIVLQILSPYDNGRLVRSCRKLIWA